MVNSPLGTTLAGNMEKELDALLGVGLFALSGGSAVALSWSKALLPALSGAQGGVVWGARLGPNNDGPLPAALPRLGQADENGELVSIGDKLEAAGRGANGRGGAVVAPQGKEAHTPEETAGRHARKVRAKRSASTRFTAASPKASKTSSAFAASIVSSHQLALLDGSGLVDDAFVAASFGPNKGVPELEAAALEMCIAE